MISNKPKQRWTNLGYYRGKIDNMTTPGLTKAMNDFAQDHQINEQTISKSIDGITEKLKSVKTPARLDFDGKYLRFIQDGKLVLVLNAMSGNPDYQNRNYQDVQNKGPLPEGSYRVKQDRIQDIDLKQGIGGAIIKLTRFKGGKHMVVTQLGEKHVFGLNRFLQIICTEEIILPFMAVPQWDLPVVLIFPGIQRSFLTYYVNMAKILF